MDTTISYVGISSTFVVVNLIPDIAPDYAISNNRIAVSVVYSAAFLVYEGAELPLKVQLTTDTESLLLLSIPPPKPAELPVKMQLTTINDWP